MPIPCELSGFTNEEGFIQGFLIPLLYRLGFTIVVNYHGRREFGKDLIFGEIDRFSHVRYYGLQAKFVPSISKEVIHDLIHDCEEAFAKDFTHPQTGQQHKISSFYALNAGSFSDEARELFFARLLPIHADNVRLIDGKDLLALDRSVAINRIESGRDLLVGILIEVRYNEGILQQIIPVLDGITKRAEHSAKATQEPVQYPALRLRVNAAASYLLKPFLVSDLPIEIIERFWAMGTTFNRTLDEASVSPLHTVVSIKIPAIKVLPLTSQLMQDIQTLKDSISKILAKLGPLVSV